MSNSRLRVLTHNIFGTEASWSERGQVLRDGIGELRPDILALQETTVTHDYDQVADIVGEGFHIVHSKERGSDGVGISIASRWPIEDVHELDLNLTERTGDFACTAMVATIQAPQPYGPILFANHFPDYQPHHEHERELQTVKVARYIEERVAGKDMHVVLAGDLDAEPDAASLRFLAGRPSLGGMSVCYRNAWESVHGDAPCPTFTPENPLMDEANVDWPFAHIDHIFVRCGQNGNPTLRIDACERAFDAPVDGVWASDHYAMIADLAYIDDTGVVQQLDVH